MDDEQKVKSDTSTKKAREHKGLIIEIPDTLTESEKQQIQRCVYEAPSWKDLVKRIFNKH